MYGTADKGQVFGITFIDHKNKVVFNGSDLGKAYTVQSITGKFRAKDRTVKLETRQELNAEKSAKRTKTKTRSPIYELPKPTRLLDMVLARPAAEEGIKIPKRKKKRRKVPAITHEPNL